MQTTAIYPNRLIDKQRVESITGLSEFGDDETVFHSRYGTVIFTGYDRVVYGDHGPYVEFDKRHLKAELIRKFSQPAPMDAFYEWLIPKDPSQTKVYLQLKDVKFLKNPPKGGFMGNRSEGYADYIPGKYYVSPYELDFKPNLRNV